MTYMCVLMEQEWFVTNWQNITTLQHCNLLTKVLPTYHTVWGDQLD